MQSSTSDPTGELRTQAEIELISSAQAGSFPEESQALKNGKQISTHSCLLPLSPEYDETLRVIRVGGRLRRSADLELDTIHPLVLDPKHPVTQLHIKHYDETLLYPGPDRVFVVIMRKYWILRGRQAFKKHQWSCTECRKWRAKPTNRKWLTCLPLEYGYANHPSGPQE